MHATSTTRAAAIAAVTAFALPAGASANLRTPHTTTIVPGEGMAGVKLDMTKAQVFGKWGHTSCDHGVCTWNGHGKPGKREVASVSFVKGKADLISIRAGTRGKHTRFNPGVLSDWETKGIH